MRSAIRLACLLVLLATAPLLAQEAATLVADSVRISGNNTLVAQGGVEVFYRGKRLKASQITYLGHEDQLVIEGPLVLSDGNGTLILADQAELTADLTEGVLKSARMVLNQQLQMSAAEIMRVGGRYTSLGRSVVSSCKICNEGASPLWEIRARRIVHDEQERQIYFDSAQLRVAGVPVFWLPYLRMPDPTLKRSTGFLTPSLRTTDGLGFGMKLPYFIRMGDHRDLTVTPYLSTRSGRTLELRYRQAFTTGKIEVSGAVTRDKLLPGRIRGYLTAAGTFRLPRDFRLSFSGEMVSDDAYYLDYLVSEKDRLDSRFEIGRTRRNEHISARLINFKSIRAGDVYATLPSFMTDLTWQRRFSPALIGGEGGMRLQSHSHYRSSTSATDSDGDGISDGRDTTRVSLTADWRRNWILPGGVMLAALTEVNADFYSIRQDAVFGGDSTRAHGGAALEFRWPWVRNDATGVSHVIEPVAQLIWSPKRASSIPDEDSVLAEFDEGNLFSLDRFPGADAVERGPRANLGLTYTRFDPAGWSLGLTLGRVIRTRNFGQFSAASGLAGRKSDWLAAMRLAVADGVTMTNRIVFDDRLDITKAELRLDLGRKTYGIASSFVWMAADASENRATPVSELSLDGRYSFASNWEGRFVTRYDFETSRAASAGLSMAFRNECLRLDMSIARRFTSSGSLNASTSFGLSVDLLGFGDKGAVGKPGLCRG